MHLDPAGCTCHVLSMILSAPAFDETQPNHAHLGELKNGLVAVRQRLVEQLRKLLIVEDLQAAARWNLADGSRMEVMVVVTGTTLHEDAAVTETLHVHLASHIV